MFNKAKKFFSWFLLNFRYSFHPHKPLLILRLVKNYILLIFFKKMLLRYVDFAIGYKCNMNCQHCFAAVLKKKGRRRITPEEYARVAKECMRLGAVNFSFQGGEPLLYNDLEDYIKSVKPHKNIISVTTNGTLLTSDMVRKLKRWGVDILTVSLDSGIAQDHDDFRGMEGAFAKTLNGIKIALKNNINVTIGAVVSHKNLRTEGIKRLIGLAKELKVILILILAVPIGGWAGRRDILITEEDMEYIKNLTAESAYIRTDFDANYLYRGCGAAKEILYITPYGDVLVCPFIQISFGNIFEKNIEEIRDTALENRYFKNYWHKCLCATDSEFIDEFLNKAQRAPQKSIAYDA